MYVQLDVPTNKIVYLEYRHHSNFNSKHVNWKGLCDHFKK
jgi:hypothetical protein